MIQLRQPKGKRVSFPSSINIGKLLKETTITLSLKDILDECPKVRKEILGQYKARKEPYIGS